MNDNDNMRIGDGPIEAEHRDIMKALAEGIDAAVNGDSKGEDRKVGFVLLLFNFNDDHGRANYISNARRPDVVRLLKEQVERFEK